MLFSSTVVQRVEESAAWSSSRGRWCVQRVGTLPPPPGVNLPQAFQLDGAKRGGSISARLTKLTSSFPGRQCREGEGPPLLPPLISLAYLKLSRSTVQRGGGSTVALHSLPQAFQVDSTERGRVHCRCRRCCRRLGPLKRRLLATVHILLPLQAAHILFRHLAHLCRGGLDGIGQRYSPTCTDTNSILIV
jgi:hypothetical protein